VETKRALRRERDALRRRVEQLVDERDDAREDYKAAVREIKTLCGRLSQTPTAVEVAALQRMLTRAVQGRREAEERLKQRGALAAVRPPTAEPKPRPVATAAHTGDLEGLGALHSARSPFALPPGATAEQEVGRLRSELAQARQAITVLQQREAERRRAELAAERGAGAARFDPAQPFGTDPSTPTTPATPLRPERTSS